jgi:hypothetical protein
MLTQHKSWTVGLFSIYEIKKYVYLTLVPEIHLNKERLRGFSPPANYIDRKFI